MNRLAKLSYILTIFASVLLSACVFEAGRKQGLVFSKADIKSITIGMTKEKIEYLVGAPSFTSGDKTIWYYIYTIKEDEEIVVDKNFETTRLPEYRTALIFKGDRLQAIDTTPISY